jgi:hypothetical protein
MTQRPTSIFVVALTKAFLAAGCGNDSGSADRESAGAGGVVASGGVFTGGVFGGGGVAATGGTTPLGTGGIVATGGALGTGGTAGAGGSPATGGAGGVGGIDAGGTGPTGDAGSGGSVGSAFPPVPYGTLTGPYTPVTITSTGPSNGYNVYHPQELGEDGLKHPVLTWGNGATTTPDNYPLLPALASHGFVVIAARSSFVTGTLLKDGLDWMLAQDSAAGPFQGNLDGERVGAFGYSLGSLATFSIGTDSLLKTTVHISGGIMSAADEGQATALTNPTAYFCDRDQTAANCDTDFAVVGSAPTFYGTVAGVHVDYMFNAGFIERFNAATIAWLRWQLMGDSAMATVFEGQSCTLCTDPAWNVQKKNMP